MKTGRPRSFDRDEALEAAVAVFWQYGYDATSIAMLTGALGIGAPSLYAAFGDKKTLFFEALDRYNHTYGAFTVRALTEEPDARAAVTRLLHDASAAYTRPDRPPGCLLITAATNCSPQSADVATHLRDIRAQARTALETKIADAARTGTIPPGTDIRALAAFYAAVLQGMSAQARDGATTTDLRHIADTALQTWPTTTT
ncbi:TetR/AcrR family transcriptional regulator [Streptomyces cocklensis]|jgi:AcrR family transcriptional regulator|uniref:Transcriptional regulator, TetR family n=1 Tax=Actinacidiphila cocklensis TaxID=887465 RepID=A0A9W4DQC8_9ACTN|nr:TetR/AcrR family transcriptional regulator [Actinacidiphila cocklensis]MDD1062681.1 TetR/AcrR family transcriptional regulator [Actinacidiphila cocklensis]WSX75444.1 TetR/AcrR family transcriptional regulator [Streptomyces sp. NBC_00899]CAG6392093.1 Transcriptional regulator, TetR family [Actinacidiphila cocklensis]